MKLHRLLVLLLSVGVCSAQADEKIDFSAFDKEQPIDFESDRMIYDHQSKILTATGNVQFKQNGILFQTDKILYNQSQDLIHIPGVATMTLPDGTISKMNGVDVYPREDEIHTGKSVLDMTDGTHLWADKAIRKNKGTEHILKDVFYTPCEMCDTQSPLWQIHAGSVEQDKEEHILRFYNARLEVKEVPVLYFPYFQTPDPTVKRKSGFLTPGFGTDSTLRKYIQTPYFFDLSPHHNLTITPVISLSENPMGILDYQGIFTKGKLNFQGSFTQENGEGKDDLSNASQGHIKADFEYDINSSWRLSGEYNRTVSDTYFRRYDSVLNSDDTQSYLTSHLTGEYYGERLQSMVRFYNFQSLQDGVDSRSIPIILPTMNLHYTTTPLDNLGTTLYSNVNAALINTRTHFKSNRISFEEGINIPYKTSFGLMSEVTGRIRMDGYSVDTGDDRQYINRVNDSYMTGRVFPQATMKLSYPLIQKGSMYRQVLEPIVMLVLGPNGSNSDKIPNVDSTAFDFDDTNLFSSNRYVGYDRVESGSRANYGVQWSVYKNGQNRFIQFLFGQSVRLRDESTLNDTMGYNGHLSSYVGRLRFVYEYFRLMYRFRLAEENLQAQKNDIAMEVGGEPLRVGVDYLFQDSYKLGNAYSQEKKEVSLYMNSRLTKNWSAEGRYRYNLLKTDKGPLETEAVVRYDNECTAFELVGSKRFTRDRNYHGNTSITFRVYLKTLGGFGK